MRSPLWASLLLVFAGCGSQPIAPSSSAPPPPPVVPKPKVERVLAHDGSAVALARVGGRLLAYIADEDEEALLVVDVDRESVISRFEVGGTPAQLVTLPDARLAVSLRNRSRVAILEGAGTTADPLRHAASIDVPREPIGLATTPDDLTLLVAGGWSHSLTAVSLADRHTLFSQDLGREPRAVAVSHDGKRAFVAHAVGAGLSIVDLEKKTVKVWNLEAENTEFSFRSMGGPFKRRSAQGFAVAVSEDPLGRVFLPHVVVHTAFGTPTEEITGYGSVEAGPAAMFDIAVVDEADGKPLDFEPAQSWNDGEKAPLVRIGSGGRSCVLPRATVVNGNNVYVACLDTDRVMELDAASIHPEQSVIRSWTMPRGPSGLAVDRPGERLVVWSSFARSLSTIATSENAKTLTLASVTVLPEKPLPAEIVRGRDLFHKGEARISSDGRACASCHPDGRDDGMVWATPDGPRQTPSLAGRLDGTAPYGWTGAAHDIESHVPKTFKRLGGTGLTGADKAALLAYVRSMHGPPPAAVVTEEAKVARGREVFHSAEAECSTCHGTDGEMPDGTSHDVKSRASGDLKKAFDTPSLKYVGGTGPWFHDGRYNSLHDLLVKSDGKMGHTKQLSTEDLDALEAFLRAR